MIEALLRMLPPSSKVAEYLTQSNLTRQRRRRRRILADGETLYEYLTQNNLSIRKKKPRPITAGGEILYGRKSKTAEDIQIDVLHSRLLRKRSRSLDRSWSSQLNTKSSNYLDMPSLTAQCSFHSQNEAMMSEARRRMSYFSSHDATPYSILSPAESQSHINGTYIH